MMKDKIRYAIEILSSALLGLAIFAFSSACKSAKNSGSATALSYKLEKIASSDGKNALIFSSPKLSGYLISISGENLTASVPLNRFIPAQERIVVNHEKVGTYRIVVRIALADGSEFLRDELSWEYTQEVPSPPIVSFSEEASSDQQVLLLVSSSRGPSVQEMWIEGDVEPQTGAWYTIPDSGKVPLILSAGDGLKTMRIKLRNRARTESASIVMAINRKGQGPVKCSAEAVAATVQGDDLRLRLSATNNGPMAYRILGDVAKVQEFQSFKDSIDLNVKLSAGNGIKNLKVVMRDEAESYCSHIPIQVVVDPNYLPYAVTINHSLLWTDANKIIIQPRFDSFASDSVEMYIEGGVQSGSKTFQWVPYQSSLELELAPNDGHRFIIVQFRLRGQLTEKVNDGIFLRPYIRIFNNSGVNELLLSQIVGLEKMTISGCKQIYTNISYQDRLPCTANGSPIEVRYELSDGTTVTRTP